MSDEVVTKDLLFYVADILVDELAQNAAVASDTKRRLRSCVENLSAFITSTRPNGDANQAKGTKRKDADRAAADMPEAKAQATVPKKAHKTSMHSVFISYGAHALPERLQEIRDKLLGKSRTMETLNKYYKSLPKSTVQQFEDTYKSFLDDYNDLSKKPQMKTLAMRLKKYDQDQGIEMHPVFDGFMGCQVQKFVEEEAALLPQGGQKPPAATPAEDSSEGEADKRAKTPPVIPPVKSATKATAKTSTGKPAAKASPPPVAVAPSKKAVAAKASVAAKAPPPKGKVAKAAAAKKAAEVLESSTGEDDSSDDDDEEDGDDVDDDDEDDDDGEEEEDESE